MIFFRAKTVHASTVFWSEKSRLFVVAMPGIRFSILWVDARLNNVSSPLYRRTPDYYRSQITQDLDRILSTIESVNAVWTLPCRVWNYLTKPLPTQALVVPFEPVRQSRSNTQTR